MPNFNFGPQQPEPGNIFAWIDELQAMIPGMTRWALAVVGAIAGFCCAGMYGAEDYTVLLVIVGFLGGLLLIQLAAFALKALVTLTIITAIALLAWMLFGYQAAHHSQRSSAAHAATISRQGAAYGRPIK